MTRWSLAFTLLLFAMSAGAAFADTVTLRTRVEAHGANITLGDVFEGAGALASRPIAPAPAPGQTATLSMPVLAAAASVAGLDFTPPAGLNGVRVVHPAGMRATLPAPTRASNPGAPAIATISAEAGVRRGDTVTLVFQAPGIALTTRARALDDGAVGQGVRLLNVSSNRTIDAIVTGPGAARADAP